MKKTIKELENEIIHHKELYYRGKAEISDEAFDKLEEELKRIDPENPVLQLVGHLEIDSNIKVQHQKKMLSLEKTYDIESLKKWLNNYDAISVYKIDGSSCSLVYENGHLAMAKTRGDGQYGENITKKAFFIKDIPKTISQKGTIEVRGEVYCLEKNFLHLSQEMIDLGLERPASQRNIVAGLLGRKEHIHLASYLSFKAFDLISTDVVKKESDKLQSLKKLGFDTPDVYLHHGDKNLNDVIDNAKEFMSNGDYLIDGLVFVINDLKWHLELGETSHHPKYKLAFKFAGESKTTKIENIEWGVSRNGVLTPVANVVPVELSGAKISRVTLHNFGLAKNYELKVGDEIEIIRSGEVIPKFLSIVKKAPGSFVYPEACPSCGKKLKIDDIWLLCSNSDCGSRRLEEILNYVQKAGIEDLSDKRIQEMLQKKFIKEIVDLYKLTPEILMGLDKVKEKMAQKIFQNIQATKKQELSQFIAAIGIEGVSKAKSEKIISNGYNSVEKILKLTSQKLQEIEGFAEKSSDAIINSIQEKESLIKNLLAIGVDITSTTISSGEGPLTGLKFCITGELSIPRAEYEKLIKEHGGVLVSSVSKNTSFLITNEKVGTSSKFQKAIQLNIPIIDENGIKKLIEGNYGKK